jgi:hypothetical protein
VARHRGRTLRYPVPHGLTTQRHTYMKLPHIFLTRQRGRTVWFPIPRELTSFIHAYRGRTTKTRQGQRVVFRKMNMSLISKQASLDLAKTDHNCMYQISHTQHQLLSIYSRPHISTLIAFYTADTGKIQTELRWRFPLSH